MDMNEDKINEFELKRLLVTLNWITMRNGGPIMPQDVMQNQFRNPSDTHMEDTCDQTDVPMDLQ